RRAGHAVHREAPGAGAPGAGLAVHRPRLGARRRHVPGGGVRHGAARPHLPRHPLPLLHRRRARPRARPPAGGAGYQVSADETATLAGAIDHTLLRPDATAAQLDQLLAEAREHAFASVCLPPVYVAPAKAALAGTAVHTGTVVGFPLGYVIPAVRIAESRQAIADGADELDTVLNVSWLKSCDDARVLGDLAAWVAAARAERSDLVLKVILETALLSDDEK